MTEGFAFADLLATVTVILVGGGGLWGLVGYLSRKDERIAESAREGDRRLHERVDNLQSSTVSRAELTRMVDDLKARIDGFGAEIKSVRESIQALANAVISGKHLGQGD